MDHYIAVLRAAAARGDQEARLKLQATEARMGCGKPATHAVVRGYRQVQVGMWCRRCAGRIADRLTRAKGQYGPSYRRRPRNEEQPGLCQGDSHPRAYPTTAPSVAQRE